MSYAEEKVFSIPDLRLVILSYYLKHPDEKDKLTCYQKFVENLNYKKEKINEKFNHLIYTLILRIHLRHYV